MAENKEMNRILQNHEARITQLEALAKNKKLKPQKTSLVSLFIVLKGEGFFSQDRTPKEILQKLAEKGFTYRRLESLTDPLKRATKQGILNRKKKDKGWAYFV